VADEDIVTPGRAGPGHDEVVGRLDLVGPALARPGLPRFDIQGDVGLPAPEYEPGRGDAGSDRRDAGPVLVG